MITHFIPFWRFLGIPEFTFDEREAEVAPASRIFTVAKEHRETEKTKSGIESAQ